MIRHRFGGALVCVALFSLAACSGSKDGHAEPVGKLAGELTLPDGSVVTSVHYVITQTGTAFMREGDIDVSNSTTLSFRISGLPIGNGYHLTITGNTSFGNQCMGSSSFDILDNQTTQVTVSILCGAQDHEGDVVVNGEVIPACPLIASISATPGQIGLGLPVMLSATLSHANQPVVWTGSGGTFGTPHAHATTFTCATIGTHVLTVAVDTLTCHDAETVSVLCTRGNGCGDGGPDPGEQCDDGNDSNTDACTDTCQNAVCGDGFTRAGVEQCDDANMSNTDACTNVCHTAACGDGFVQAGVEQCDDSNTSNTDACTGACQIAVCGDGFVQAGVEQCDDANASNTDGCTNTCQIAVCGDGFVQAGEQCDDGNASNTDACTNACLNAVCGDGFTRAGGEQCDDANASNTDACTNACLNAVCGDGFLRSSVERCDDSNTQNGDGCSSVCNPEPVQLAVGQNFNCARFPTGAVKCWGHNASGQLGRGDMLHQGDAAGEMDGALQPIDLGTGHTVKSVVAGSDHACAILENDAVKCWGMNSFGQLGLGNNLARGDGPGEMGDSLPVVDLGTGRSAKLITAGYSHNCALLDNDTVKCWGNNTAGQLGLGNTNHRGDAANEMGNNLPVVDLGTGRTAKALAGGSVHTCALLDNNTVKCWGSNSRGQLGLGDMLARGDGAGEMGNSLPAIDLGTGRTAKAVVAPDGHSCALLDNNTIKCWGANSMGALGLGDTNDRGDVAGEMGDSLPAVALGTGRTGKSLGGGMDHVCAILDNDSVKCWGSAVFGQLGQGSTAARGDAAGEMGDALAAVDLGAGRTVREVNGGQGHTCARLDNNTVKCWGRNTFGNLGQGDTIQRGDNPGEMGNNLLAILLW